MSSNESEPILFPWFAPGVHPARFNPWKPSERDLLGRLLSAELLGEGLLYPIESLLIFSSMINCNLVSGSQTEHLMLLWEIDSAGESQT